MYATKKVTWKSNIQSTFKFAAPHFPWLKFFTTLYLFIYFISFSCQKTPPFNHTKNFVRSHSNFRRLHSNICKQVKFYCKRIFMQINWKFEFQVYCHFRRVVSEYILQVKMRLKRLSWNGFFCQFIRTSEIRAYSLEKNYKANLRITFEIPPKTLRHIFAVFEMKNRYRIIQFKDSFHQIKPTFRIIDKQPPQKNINFSVTRIRFKQLERCK